MKGFSPETETETEETNEKNEEHSLEYKIEYLRNTIKHNAELVYKLQALLEPVLVPKPDAEEALARSLSSDTEPIPPYISPRAEFIAEMIDIITAVNRRINSIIDRLDV